MKNKIFIIIFFSLFFFLIKTYSEIILSPKFDYISKMHIKSVHITGMSIPPDSTCSQIALSEAFSFGGKLQYFFPKKSFFGLGGVFTYYRQIQNEQLITYHLASFGPIHEETRATSLKI